MDTNETIETIENTNYLKEIAKSAGISAATTAGMIVGFLAVGFVWSAFDEWRDARKAKKNPTTEK